ncbi:hypothetical protein [Klebsiella pneumoniae]|uniref:hypothetical protein n=1 Tax=Klebsiella pneumoniae TaxID=573 RepID=UPI001E49E14E|nr:hypothetical protein [Klebsiella pneumoniae]
MIGFGEGGSGGGSIEPGDTAADYDSIRNYTGTATVRDVVGQRIAGRFVVNPDDTTSGKYRAGYWSMCWDAAGIAVRNLSAMTCLWPPCSVCYAPCCAGRPAMGNCSSAIAYLSGVEAADAAIQNAHRYANLLNIPVRQNDGAFLVLVDHEAEVRTKTYTRRVDNFTSADSGVNEIRWGHCDCLILQRLSQNVCSISRGKNVLNSLLLSWLRSTPVTLST